MTINKPPKKYLVLLSFVMLAGLTLQAPEMFASGEHCSARQKICFQWSFVANVKKEKKQLPINLNKNVVLESGDQLHTSFTLKKPCFLYFIHNGPGDEVTLLYPFALPQKLPSSDMPVTYHIPKNGQWFVLDDNAGKETFYLVASSMRLGGLESLFLDYNESNGSQKIEIRQKIIKKVEKFNQQSSKLTAAAERPAKIGGTVRGVICQNNQDNQDSKIFLNTFDSLMVSANDFYIKVITIDHK